MGCVCVEYGGTGGGEAVWLKCCNINLSSRSLAHSTKQENSDTKNRVKKGARDRSVKWGDRNDDIGRSRNRGRQEGRSRGKISKEEKR